MTAPADPDTLAQQVYRLLQRSQYAEAVTALPTLIAAADQAERPDLCARAWTWLGHAHLQRNELKDARAALRKAAAIATALGDTAGLAAISGLRQAVGAKAMQAAPSAHEDTPIARAAAALDRGDHTEGAALARAAFDQAVAERNDREQVLALLALARVPAHTTEAIHHARAVADRSNDRNLVTAVAHAARAAGVQFAPKVF